MGRDTEGHRTIAAVERFGDYRLLRPLREGGMASVWLAERAGERVALKRVRPELARSDELRRMLLEEARVAARVVHPNVVRILEVGEVDRTPYLAMEHVDGVTWAELLDGAPEPAPIAHVVRIASLVAEGLHAAHEARDASGASLELVHRDVSPPNVMISRAGEVKLIDFGIARARGRAIETSEGTLKGRFRYLAPEQVTRGAVDRRTDVYALAMVTWEALTKQRYLDGSLEVEILLMARHPRPRPPSRLRASIDSAIDRALLEALAPSIDERTPTARALAEALLAACPLARSVSAAELARGIAGEVSSTER